MDKKDTLRETRMEPHWGFFSREFGFCHVLWALLLTFHTYRWALDAQSLEGTCIFLYGSISRSMSSRNISGIEYSNAHD